MIKRAAAAATLLAILIGLPLTLITLGADPLAWPSWATIRSAITTPDDGTLILGILKGAAWLIWAALAVSIVIEAVARVRGREAAPAPIRRQRRRLGPVPAHTLSCGETPFPVWRSATWGIGGASPSWPASTPTSSAGNPIFCGRGGRCGSRPRTARPQRPIW